MAEPSLAVQRAILARLNAQLPTGTGIYDEAPHATEIRYVQIGDDAWTQDDSHDDDDGEEGDQRGWTGIISIEVWDAFHAGRAWIKEKFDQIDAALHNHPLAVTGFTTNWLRYQSSQTQRAEDRPLYRGVITFEIRLEAA